MPVKTPPQEYQTLEYQDLGPDATFDQAPMGIAHVSLTGAWLRVNTRFCDIAGYPQDELLRRTSQSITYPDDAAANWKNIQYVLAGERPEARMETRYLRLDGGFVWITLHVSLACDPQGAPLYLIFVAEDITIRKRVEEELRATNERQRMLLETLEEGIAVADVQGQLTYANPSAERILRLRRNQIEVRAYDDSVWKTVSLDGQPLDSAEHPIAIALTQGQPIHGVELGIEHPGGEYTYLSVNAVPLRDAHGTVCGAMASFRDITARLISEKERELLLVQVQQGLNRQQALVNGLIMAQEEERRALAYDLHDGLTQYVMASSAHLEAFLWAYETGQAEKAGIDLHQASRYLRDATVESRRLVNGLRLLALDDIGLVGALEQLLAEEKSSAGWMDASFSHNLAGRTFDQTIETTIYRIAQEALTNARKHARSPRVRLMLMMDAEPREGHQHLTLEVEDWGDGFWPEKRMADAMHVGLLSMAQRAQFAGGNWSVQSELSAGTLIQAVFKIKT